MGLECTTVASSESPAHSPFIEGSTVAHPTLSGGLGVGAGVRRSERGPSLPRREMDRQWETEDMERQGETRGDRDREGVKQRVKRHRETQRDRERDRELRRDRDRRGETQ